jgi:flagellar biosynthesis protein FlhF
MGAAMQLVREALGDDAIIVSTHESGRGRGVQVTAAIEEPDGEPAAQAGEEQAQSSPFLEDLKEALSYHGVPDRQARHLVLAAANSPCEESTEALAAALDHYLTFCPLSRVSAPLMFVGPPGAGKTTALVKYAAQLALQGRAATVVTTDTIRAGAVSQLNAYMRITKQPLHTAESPEHLHARVRAAASDARVLIDTPGTNPYSETELADLARFVRSGDIEPVLVLPAGLDSAEAAEMAAAYAPLGCRLAVFTRLDVARRFGSLLAALDGGNVAIANVSHSASVAQTLVAVNPLSLARIFTCDPAQGSELNTVGAKSA